MIPVLLRIAVGDAGWRWVVVICRYGYQWGGGGAFALTVALAFAMHTPLSDWSMESSFVFVSLTPPFYISLSVLNLLIPTFPFVLWYVSLHLPLPPLPFPLTMPNQITSQHSTLHSIRSHFPPTPLSHSLIPIRSDFDLYSWITPVFFFICYNYLWTVWCLGTWYLPSHWYLSMGLNDFVVFSFFLASLLLPQFAVIHFLMGPPLLFSPASFL